MFVPSTDGRGNAKVNVANERGESSLGLALQRGHRDVVTVLRRAGAREVPAHASRKHRRESLRWMGDLLDDRNSPVFVEEDVDRAPAIKEVVKPEALQDDCIKPVSFGFHTEDKVLLESRHSAVASLIVERDGSVHHASVIAASSEPLEIAVDRVLEDYVFEAGERDGQPVRTRVTLPIMLYN